MSDLRPFDRKQVLDSIASQLPHQAMEETRNRKRLKSNPLAEWEMRVGEFRVFYDVTAITETVVIAAVAQKRGAKLYLRGKEFEI